MNFVSSIKQSHLKTFTINGRASRSEYWIFVLYSLLVLVLGLLILWIGSTDSQSNELAIGIFLFISLAYSMWLVVISISLLTRRFHDTGRSGYWVFAICCIGVFAEALQEIDRNNLAFILLQFLPFLLSIPALFFAGDLSDNEYGPPAAIQTTHEIDSEHLELDKMTSEHNQLASELDPPRFEKHGTIEAKYNEEEKTEKVVNSSFQSLPIKSDQRSKDTTPSKVDYKEDPLAKKLRYKSDYEAALHEIETGNQQKGLWAICFSSSANEEEAKREYINLRAQEIINEREEKIRSELIKQREHERTIQKEKYQLAQQKKARDQELISKLPELISWASGNDFQVTGGNLEEGYAPWRIRKLPFGTFVEFKDDLSLATHIFEFYKKSKKYSIGE